MRDLNKLRTKYQETTINDIPLKIYGLNYEELSVMADLLDKKQNKEAQKYLLVTTLSKDITEEELTHNGTTMDEFINKLSSQVATKVILMVKDLSGLKDKEEPKK